jgi:hypothetical protein
MVSEYPFGIFDILPLFESWFLITPLVSLNVLTLEKSRMENPEQLATLGP